MSEVKENTNNPEQEQVKDDFEQQIENANTEDDFQKILDNMDEADNSDYEDGEPEEPANSTNEVTEEPETSNQDDIQPDDTGKLNIIKIDDNFIKNADESDRKYLESIKNEQISQKALNNYLNAQKGIRELQGERGDRIRLSNRLKELTQKVNLPPKDNVNAINDLKNQVLVRRMKAKFPDYPETKEQEDDLMYEKGFRYMQQIADEEKKEREQVNNFWDNMIDARENYTAKNTDVLNKAVDEIKKQLEMMNITPNDLKMSFKTTQEGDFEDEKLEKLFFDANGNLDEEVFITQYGAPLVRGDKFAEKFILNYWKDIYSAVATKSSIQGAKQKRMNSTRGTSLSDFNKTHENPSFRSMEEKVNAMSEEEIKKELGY
jgi:hypothetical protein